jgi:hypothetical protein
LFGIQTCKCKGEFIQTKAFNNSILDIFGYTGYSVEDNAVVVAFRSTVSLQNWIVDLDATQVESIKFRLLTQDAKDVKYIKDSTMASQV